LIVRVSALLCGLALATSAAAGKAEQVVYELTIAETALQIGGRTTVALTVNGGIPGPILRFTEGDEAVIRVQNLLDVESSIHWHGILLPNPEDGVPYLTTPPIEAGGRHEFRFRLIQSGTYWYHSHTNLQEQRGVYGTIVILPRGGLPEKTDHDYVLALSDWTHENPDAILRALKRGSDWYSIRKGQRQSLAGAAGRPNGLSNLWQRSLRSIPQPDVSDVAYDAFLANGKPEDSLEAAPGEKIRVRIVAAGASTYFHLQFAGGPLRIVSADGQDVEPLDQERFLMGIAESYDVLVTVPEGGAYELRATAQDGSGHTSLWLGRGPRVAAPDVPKPDVYDLFRFGRLPNPYLPRPAKKPGMSGGGMGSMASAAVVPQPGRPGTPYASLRSPKATTLPANRPVREYRIVLSGDMERYVWMMNGKILEEADELPIRRGENVRFVMTNTTMMNHPMHLHGHFFRVVNGQGDHAPLKHTVDVAPFDTTTIEFAADEEKDWFFHCHVLYHLAAGMARVVHYEGSTLSPDLVGIREKLYEQPLYAWVDAALLSQMNEGVAVVRDARNDGVVEWENGWDRTFDVSATYERYINRLLMVRVGGNFTEDARRAIFGVRYLLPLAIESGFWVGTDGNVRIELAKELVVTSRLSVFAGYEFNSEEEDEWLAGAAYVLTREISVAFQYHSIYGAGAGAVLRF
jgi:FtsP/CotA-like multicopper oxidase with cupredoxin domain